MKGHCWCYPEPPGRSFVPNELQNTFYCFNLIIIIFQLSKFKPSLLDFKLFIPAAETKAVNP